MAFIRGSLLENLRFWGLGDVASSPIIARLDKVAEGVVHHPIPKWGGGNQALFGFVRFTRYPLLSRAVRVVWVRGSLQLEQLLLCQWADHRPLPWPSIARRGFGRSPTVPTAPSQFLAYRPSSASAPSGPSRKRATRRETRLRLLPPR